MQQIAQPIDSGRTARDPTRDYCPECGAPIDGIAAVRPGEHQFTGCQHAASERFLRPLTAASVQR